MSMKLAYIAGPYRAASEYEVHCNIQLAERCAVRAWRSGYAAICPHKNSAYLGGCVDDEVILEGDMEMLRKCDCVILLPGHEKSAGTIAELEEAVRCGLAVCDYDEGRDRIVMRPAVAPTYAEIDQPQGKYDRIPLRCSYCRDPQGDPRRAWIFGDDSVMCAGCVGEHVRCEVCTMPLLGKLQADHPWRGQRCARHHSAPCSQSRSTPVDAMVV